MTCPTWLYYTLASVLLVMNASSAALNLVALPGNWFVVTWSLLFTWLVRSSHGIEMSWQVIPMLVGLALLGEGIELLAGTAGAAKQGASRRGMALSIVGSIAGSILGAVLGLPIPVVGSAIAALIGGALGAFAGAAVGEDWKGRELSKSWAVGRAAFWGRLWGTAGKSIVGVVMVVIATVDSFT